MTIGWFKSSGEILREKLSSLSQEVLFARVISSTAVAASEVTATGRVGEGALVLANSGSKEVQRRGSSRLTERHLMRVASEGTVGESKLSLDKSRVI
jgi:hypothetical protein